MLHGTEELEKATLDRSALTARAAAVRAATKKKTKKTVPYAPQNGNKPSVPTLGLFGLAAIMLVAQKVRERRGPWGSK